MIDNPSTSRVLIIGLDGATFDIFDHLLEQGIMPNLSKIIKTGVSGELRSSIPPLTAPAWTSFMSGKHPGKHGIMNFLIHPASDVKNERFVPVNSSVIGEETIWSVLSRQGYRVCTVNVPMTYPAQEINGIMLTGMFTPPGAPFTYPPDLTAELIDYQIDLEYFLRDLRGMQKFPELKSLIKKLRNLLEQRTNIVKELLRKERWDLFMVVFTGTDRLGHFLLPYHWKKEGDDEHNEIQAMVYDYYTRLDEIIADLIESMGDDTSVIFMSDHGMGKVPQKIFNVNEWLKQQNILSLLPVKRSWKNVNSLVKLLGLSRNKLVKIRNVLPKLKFITKMEKRAKVIPLPIDHQTSKAYARTLYNIVGGIYIEERIKKDSDDYDNLCKEIIDGLSNVIDIKSGESIVDQAALSIDIYGNRNHNCTPDIIVILKDGYKFGQRFENGLLVSENLLSNQVRNKFGDHRMNGLFIADGIGIRQKGEKITGLNITDILPTILFLLDAEIPDDLDGKIIFKALNQKLLGTRTPKYTSTSSMRTKEYDLTPDQQNAILERLQDLDYLD